MLSLLPLASLACITWLFGNLRPEWGWRIALHRAVIAAGAYLVLATEVLSLLHWITPFGLGLAWGWPVAAIGAWGLRAARRGRNLHWPRVPRHLGWGDGALLGVLAAILLLTGIAAVKAPPNTWDSLTYHMSRVAHWAQNRSLAPFATGIERQNYMSPGAELGVLQAYVLGRGDQWVNLVSWVAMTLSILNVTTIARHLGAHRTGQLLAAVSVASLPMGIAQASSTMTDYVLSLWLTGVALEAVLLWRGLAIEAGVLGAGAAAGLAILTKPTAIAFLLPLAVFLAAILWKRIGLRRTFLSGLAAVVMILILNLGYLARNQQVFGSPLGDPSRLGAFANQGADWRIGVSNLVRNASMHASTPWKPVDRFFTDAVIKIHLLMDFPLNDPRGTSHGEWLRVGKPGTSETGSVNTAQAVLIVVAMAIALLRRSLRTSLVLGYGLMVAATFVTYSFVFQWQVFGSRLVLPFFVLAGAFVGTSLSAVLPRPGVVVLGLVVAALSWSWLTRLDERPLLPFGESGRSVFVTPRATQRFVLSKGLQAPLTELTSFVRSASCGSVGIMIGGDSPEYLLWSLLGAPRDDLRIEWLVAGTPSARFVRPDFQPCAVICETCPDDQTEVRGLPRVREAGGYDLFLAPKPSGGP